MRSSGFESLCAKETKGDDNGVPDDIAKKITCISNLEKILAVLAEQTLNEHDSSKKKTDDEAIENNIDRVTKTIDFLIGHTDFTYFKQAVKQGLRSYVGYSVTVGVYTIMLTQQNTIKMGPLSAKHAVSIFRAMDAIIGPPKQSEILSWIYRNIKCGYAAGCVAGSTAERVMLQKLRQNLAGLKVISLGAGYSETLKDQVNLKEVYGLGHSRVRDFAMGYLKDVPASEKATDEHIVQLTDSEYKRSKRDRQADALKYSIDSSTSVLSERKNYDLIYMYLDCRKKHVRQRISSISINDLRSSNEYSSSGQRSSRDDTIGPEISPANKTTFMKLGSMTEGEEKRLLESTVNSDSVHSSRNGDPLRLSKRADDDVSLVPETSPSGADLRSSKELLPIKIGKDVDQRPKNVFREKSHSEIDQEFGMLIQSYVEQVRIPSKLCAADECYLPRGQSLHGESSDLWVPEEESGSERDSLDGSGIEIFSQNYEAPDFSDDREITTSADAESSQHSQGSSIPEIMSSNGAPCSDSTPAQPIAEQFQKKAVLDVSESKSKASLTGGEDVTGATASKRRSDTDLATDAATDSTLEMNFWVLEIMNDSDASSLDDEDMSSPTRLRFVRPVIASSPDTSRQSREYSEWIPVALPISSSADSSSYIVTQDLHTLSGGRLSSVSPVGSSYCFGGPLAHPQDESGPSVSEEQLTLVADHIRTTRFTAGPNRLLFQNPPGATVTQTAVPDDSQSRCREPSGDSAPLRLPPITVHAAGALPPWATRTARIDLSRAANRPFAQLRERRATYDDDWPNHSGIDPANMALAGFFRPDGRGRRVRCFYCGLELDNLNSGHNVWDEHVRFRPSCPYLVAIMGRDKVLETQINLAKQS